MTSHEFRHKQPHKPNLKTKHDSDGFTSLSRDNITLESNQNELQPNSTGQQCEVIEPTTNEPVVANDHATFFERVIAVMCYCISSILMTVANKYVFSAKNFNMNFMLLAIQSLFCTIFLYIFRLLRLATFKQLNSKNVGDWFHVTLLMIGMIYTSSKGLKYLPVANFTVCKNLLIIVMAWFDVKYFGGYVDRLMVLSFYLIIAGSVVGGYSDITFNLLGYVWLVLNCVFTAAYLLEMRRCIKKIGFQNFDTVYYNNTLSIPVLVLLSVFLDDWKLYLNSYYNDGPFVAQRSLLYTVVLLSCFTAFSISYATCWCLKILTSTSYSIAGALNKLPIAVSGLVFFKSERNFSVGNISSIALSFTGGLVYSIAQIRLRNRDKTDTPNPPILPAPVVYKKVCPFNDETIIYNKAGASELSLKDSSITHSKINPHLLPITDHFTQNSEIVHNKV